MIDATRKDARSFKIMAYWIKEFYLQINRSFKIMAYWIKEFYL